MIEVISIDTPALGDRSYLATDGQNALVVDPQRDIDRVPVTDGDAVGVGNTMTAQVMATPGHAFTHLSYALQDAVVAIDDDFSRAGDAGLLVIAGMAPGRAA